MVRPVALGGGGLLHDHNGSFLRGSGRLTDSTTSGLGEACDTGGTAVDTASDGATAAAADDDQDDQTRSGGLCIRGGVDRRGGVLLIP